VGKVTNLALAMVILFTITSICINVADAKVTVHSITVSTDKEVYILGSEAVAKAQLDYTGSKKDLLGVNFTWYYPNGSVAKFEGDVAPDGSGTSYSSWWPDKIGLTFLVNATYFGDDTIFDETEFDVEIAPPSNIVSGPIGVDTTWTLALSPYIVVGDVFVESQATLTIEPGVVVEFVNDMTLVINGTLLAKGNETNMITFTSNNSNPVPGDWKGIEFNYAKPESEISYARIEYAYIGINIFNSSPKVVYNLIRDVNRTGIQVYKSTSYIGYNSITHIVYSFASNKGINLISESDVTIEGNVISDVEEYGIKITDSNPTVRANTISGSIYNIECINTKATIENNTLYDAVSAIRVASSQDILITQNDISDCTQYGVSSEWSSVRIRGNYIHDNPGSGLRFYRSYDVEVIDNLIVGNERGVDSLYSNNLIISENQIVNQTKDGIYAEDSETIDLYNNVIINSENGTYFKSTQNISLKSNVFTLNKARAIFFFNCTRVESETDNISSNNIGIYLHSTTASFFNSTLDDSSERDILLTEKSHLSSLNSTFDSQHILVSFNCTLIVKNYLHIYVQNASYQPYSDVEVEGREGNNTLFSYHMDSEGRIGFIVLTDRIYFGSNTPSENDTSLEVKNGSVFLEDNPRDVDMSYSHLEVFSPGNPLSINIDSPLNNSLAFDMANITGSATSLGSNMVSIEINIDGEKWILTNSTDGDWSKWWYLLDTTQLEDGEHVIFARISSSFYTIEKYIIIWVDNTGNKPPVLSITSHEPYETVNGTIELRGIAFDYDGNVESVDVRVDSIGWTAANNLGGDWSNWSFEIDTTQYPNGTYNLTVMAMDNETESMVVTIELVFKNKEGGGNHSQNGENGDNGEDGENGNDTESEDGPQELLPLFVVLIPLILCILLYIIIRRRKEKELEEESHETEEE
jgi:parallel beta-helix repeat protein